MLKSLTLNLLIASVTLIITQVLTPVKAHAQTEEFCIAVYPCLESGEIDPRYDVEGSCGDKFRAQCTAAKTSLITDDLVSCQKISDKSQAEIISLKKELVKLRKKLARKK